MEKAERLKVFETPTSLRHHQSVKLYKMLKAGMCMTLDAVLREVGFNASEAVFLANHNGFHHKRKTREDFQGLFCKLATAYDCDVESVKKAILTHPQFAGLDHERVIRQKSRLGRLVGLTGDDVRNKILSKPSLAGYAVRRYLAAIDIGRILVKEGYDPTTIRDRFFTYFTKSPYVPGTTRQRINQVNEPNEEPPLLTTLRKTLARQTS